MGDEKIPDFTTIESPPRQSLNYQEIQSEKDPLGSGGQAIVYRVDVPGNMPPNQVAIKEPLGGSQTLSRDDIQSFLEEAGTWETVDRREREKPRWRDTEHIVGVVDTGDKLPWIAMEYMDGGDLGNRLEANPDGLPIEEALWIGECVCRGVELAHSYGIAHLDLKPANVLFRQTPNGAWNVPKIADWGLARVLAERTGTMEGLSVKYAAPEQFEPAEFGDPDTLTDIYQVGTLVYALLTGNPPYTGGQASVMYDIVHGDDPEPPGSHRSNLGDAIDTTVMLALETVKTDRYRNITAFEQALQAIRTDQPFPPVVARRISSKNKGRTIVDTSTKINNPNEDVSKGGGVIETDEPDNTRLRGVVDILGKSEGYGFVSADESSKGALYKIQPTDASPIKQGQEVELEQHFEGNTFKSDVTLYDESGGYGAIEMPRTDDNTPLTLNDIIIVNTHGGYLASETARMPVEWPMFQGNPARTGCRSTTGPQESPTKRWEHKTDGKIKSSPVVADGTVYVGSMDGNVYALGADHGRERWCFPTDAKVDSSPVVANSTVYIGSSNGNVYALNASNGEERWRFRTDGPVKSSPAIADDTVYVGSHDGCLYALDATDGTERWCFQTDSCVGSSPAVVNDTVYVGSSDNHVYALDTLNGTERWHFETEGWVVSSPAVTYDTVYVGSCDNRVYALDVGDGTERWRFETEGWVKSSPAVVDGVIYVGSHDESLYAIDAINGTERWQVETGSRIKSSPVVADGFIYFGSDDGNVHALEAGDGTECWHTQTEDWVYSSPAVAAGTIYIGGKDKHVYALSDEDRVS